MRPERPGWVFGLGWAGLVIAVATTQAWASDGAAPHVRAAWRTARATRKQPKRNPVATPANRSVKRTKAATTVRSPQPVQRLEPAHAAASPTHAQRPVTSKLRWHARPVKTRHWKPVAWTARPTSRDLPGGAAATGTDPAAVSLTRRSPAHRPAIVQVVATTDDQDRSDSGLKPPAQVELALQPSPAATDKTDGGSAVAPEIAKPTPSAASARPSAGERPDRLTPPARLDAAQLGQAEASKSQEQECEAALKKRRTASLRHIGLDIRIPGKPGDDFPIECSARDESPVQREWPETIFTWKASALCHKPLYFEEPALARYGHSKGPFIQPLYSAGHFFVTLPILPYMMGVTPPTECMYSLGHYRPGSCAPYLIPPVPISLRGALLEGGAAVGTAAVLP